MQKRLLSDYIIEDIKTMLRDGRLQEGEKLPNQNEFSRILGVSRVSLREALRILENKGVIQQGPRIGTIILKGNPDSWNSSDKDIELTENDVMQMLVARKCVETTINLEAAKHLTAEQGEALFKISADMNAEVENWDIENFLSKDKEYHMIVAEACGNKYLRSMYEITLRQEDDLMKEILASSESSIFKKLVASHQSVSEAIVRGDAEKVKRATSQHYLYLENVLSGFLRRNFETQEVKLYYP